MFSNQTLETFLTPYTDIQYYSLSQLNDLFAQLAALLNSKLDSRGPLANGNILLNGKRIINLAPAKNPEDIVTLGQLKAHLGLGGSVPPVIEDTELGEGGDVETYQPTELTVENFQFQFCKNIEAFYQELAFKIQVGDTDNVTGNFNMNGFELRSVGKAINDNDAATYENYLELTQ